MKRTIYINEETFNELTKPKKKKTSHLNPDKWYEDKADFSISSSGGDFGYAHVIGGDAGMVCEEVNDTDLHKYIESYLDFLERNDYKINPRPAIEFNNEQQDGMNIRTGYYDPDERKVVVFINGRHVKDILRSFAHEMVHHMQNLRDEHMDWGHGGDLVDDDRLRELEGEAYHVGNILFREWTEELKKWGKVNESKKKVKNDSGEVVPEKCDKCGGKVVCQIHGEPVYVCKDCGKYFGTMPFTLKESINWTEKLKSLKKRRDPANIENWDELNETKFYGQPLKMEESEKRFETWYRGYKAKYGSDYDHLLWLTDDIDYARSYGNRVEEVILDEAKMNVASIEETEDVGNETGEWFDYIDGPSEELALEMLRRGFNCYCFEANDDSSYCMCLWDKSVIVSRRELSREEFDKIEGYEGYSNPGYDTELNEAKESDVDLSSFKIQDKLNPKIWVNDLMDSRVRLKLLDIAQDFVEFLDVTWVKPEDTIVVGSIANYNWSRYSDIDLHVVIDYSKVDDRKKFVENYFQSKKKEWNDTHDKISIFGFPVELYVQDKDADNASSAVYSIDKNKWLKKPTRNTFTKKDIDSESIKKRASKIMTDIENIEDDDKDSNDEYRNRKLYDRSSNLIDDITNKRKKSLSATKDEMNTDNLVFKVLRRNGYLDKLFNLRDKTYDKMNSLD